MARIKSQPTDGMGLDNDAAEDAPQIIPEETQGDAQQLAPATSADLKEKRTEYAQKTRFGGGTVFSLTRSERNNRVGQNTVFVICPQHGTACKNGGTEGIMSRYYCPCEGCKFTHKLVQPTLAQQIDKHAKKFDSKRS